MRRLAEALPFFKNLKTLYLDSNRIGDKGAESLAEFLKAHVVWVICRLIELERCSCDVRFWSE